jgi:hypothetical protein
MNVKLMNNAAISIPPNAETAEPLAGTGQLLTNAVADTNATATVTPGLWLLTAYETGSFLAGLATTATATNIKWCASVGGPGVVIRIPVGTTTLHYQTAAANGRALLVKLASAVD